MSSNTSMPEWFWCRVEDFHQRKSEMEIFPFDPPPDADERGFLSCHQNDYLRLSAHPEVIAAKNEATRQTGSGAMASMTYGGAHDFHAAFRQRVARVARADSPDGVLIATSGWSGNVGLIEALARENTPIYIDMAAHASLWDGGRLSAGRVVPVRHNRPSVMDSFIESYGPGIIVIDSFYSTTGAVAPVADYVEIAEKRNCILVLDEAHSFGMIGPAGGGLAVELGLENRVHFRTVSLAKALGGSGGLLVTSGLAGLALPYWMRPSIFSSAPPPANSAGNDAALAIIEREPELAAHTLRMAARLRDILIAADVDVGPSACQIVSLRIKQVDAACRLYDALKKRNILCAMFLPPAVPADTSLLRFSIYCKLTESDIDYIGTEVISQLKKLGLESRFPGRRSAHE